MTLWPTDLTVGHGTFETASGNRYQTVILPNVSLLSQAALDRLHTFASGGGHVLFLGRTPSLISGRTILDARTRNFGGFFMGFGRSRRAAANSNAAGSTSRRAADSSGCSGRDRAGSSSRGSVT